MDGSSGPVGWADLPDEIVENVFESLSAGECIHLGLVDKRCQAVFKSTKVRYNFMLMAHHLVDVNPEQSPHDKLKELEARQEAWSTLVPRKTDYQFTVDGATSIYELQEGVFLHTEGNIDWLDQVRGVKPHLLRLLPLPWSDDRLMKDVPRETRDVGFDVADLTFDPTQDLIVISEKLNYERSERGNKPLLRYHLLTISSLTPHPLATRIPLFSIDDSPRIRNVYQLLQILGETLAVSATPATSVIPEDIDEDQHTRTHMVRVWNWKTGELLTELVLPVGSSPPAIILLDEQRFLLVRDVDHQIHLDVYGFNGLQDASNPGLAKLLVRFSMGGYRSRSRSNLELRSILARPDPPFPSTTVPTPLGKLKPFTEDPANGLLVLSLQFVLHAGGFPVAQETVVFLLKEELLKMTRKHEALLAEQATTRAIKEEERVIEWEEWKHLTRIIDEPEAAPRWVCFVHGYRYVTRVEMPLSDDDDEDDDQIPRQSQLQIFDFSPTSIRKFELEYGHMLGPGRDNNFFIFPDYAIQYYSRDHSSRVYLEESRHAHFETSLPYLVITRTVESYEITGLMIDEARIIMSHSNDPMDRRSTFTVLTM